MGLRERLRALVGRSPPPAPVAPRRSRGNALPRAVPARAAPSGPVLRAPTVPVYAPTPAASPVDPARLHVSLAGARPDPASIPLDRPLLVTAVDELDAAAFAEVLCARGAPDVSYAAAAAGGAA